MHLIKPSWLAHQGEGRDREIYSVSISPDGERLASGGQDCKVRIWSTGTIIKGIKEEEPEGPRQLCSMSNHNGAVTVVRFSPSGKYLASGSDDRVVLIWAKDDTRQPRQEYGQEGEADSEVWVAQKRLTAHENDVQDLAWSPDGALLVTVGLDSSIIIWSGTTFEKLKTLNPHGSHVKGITFDPANKYFATASDDRSVKIFRYHRTGTDTTFQLETNITGPFDASPLSTYFRRLSWSPDGTLIAAPNATNGPVSTVALINRGKWDADISLVGHDLPCEVAAFCTRVFTPQQPQPDQNTDELDTIQVIATASQDKTLAIWNSASTRPLLVAKNVTDRAITDIVWNPEGTLLFASSLDGSILLASFAEGELGYPLPISGIQDQLTRYGGGRDALQIAESVDQLRLEEQLPKDQDVNEKKMTEIMGNGQGESTSFPNSANINDSNNNINNTETQQPERQAAPSTATTSTTTATTPTSSPASKSTVNRLPQPKVHYKDGKKRVAPQLITTSQPSSSTTQRPAPSHSATTNGEKQLHVLEVSQPSHALPRGGVSTLVVGAKRKTEETDGLEETGAKKAKQEEAPQFIRPAFSNPASTVSNARIGVPKVRTFFATPGINDDADASRSVLEIRNGSGNESEPTRVTVSKGGHLVFADFLPRHGHMAAGEGSTFWAVATEDGSLYLYSPTGRRLMPPITLESQVSFLESSGGYLLAITSIGMAHVWNIHEQTAVHAPVSLAPILDIATKFIENGLVRAPTITQTSVTSGGKIIITLTNGAGYTYNENMLVWSRISEEWWSIGSQFWDSSTTRSSSSIRGMVNLVERRTNDVQRRGRGQQLQQATRNRMLQGGYEGFETVVSLAHLENRLGAAIMLESKHEIKEFFINYAYQLAEHAMTERVDELCKELMGPVVVNGNNGESKPWDPELCGIEKHELLKLVLEKIGKMRQVQRVVVDYAKAMGMF